MNKKTITIIVEMTLISILLAACASNASPNILSIPTWKLISYGSTTQPTDAIPGLPTSIKFGMDGKLSGSMGCNTFFGDFSVMGDKVKFGPIGSTEMACAKANMDQESAVLRILTGTAKWTLVNDRLTISSADGNNILILARIERIE